MLDGKDKYHLDIIKSTIAMSDNTDCLDKIILGYNLSEKETETLFEMLSEFEMNDFKYSDLEAAMKNTFGIDRQKLKGILINLYDGGRFIPVVAKYLQSNYNSYGNVSIEFNRIFNNLVMEGHIKT